VENGTPGSLAAIVRHVDSSFGQAFAAETGIRRISTDSAIVTFPKSKKMMFFETLGVADWLLQVRGTAVLMKCSLVHKPNDEGHKA
jgi:hypothetical protein